MGSLFYVISYTAIARNVSASALATALAAVPRDVLYETLLGLQELADTTVTFSGLYARRSISYTSTASAVAPDNVLGSFLTNLYTSKFSQALSTRVIAAPVVTAPRPAPPVLWVNAQYGVSAAVDDWADLSGNAHDLLQVTLAKRPAFSPNGFAPDVATVTYVGGSKLFQSNAPLAYDEFSYLMTFKSPALSVPGMLFERSVDATANPGERLYQSAAPTHSILARRVATVHSGDAPPGWGVDGNWHLAAFVYSHALGGQLFIDGVLSASFVTLPVQAVTATLFVGAESAGTLPITGDMREIFVFNLALTGPQLSTMAAYMNPQVGL